MKYYRKKLIQYWERSMKSVHEKMSEGAFELSRIIPCARGECWRRTGKDKIQRGHEKKKS